jgi:hypothetical protein
MRLLVLTLLAISLASTVGCSKRKRAEKLEGTWYGVSFETPGSGAETEPRKFAVTFGADGSYKTTAKCSGSEGRAKAKYSCDDSKPISGTYELRQVTDRSVILRLPPAGDDLEFEFKSDGSARYRMWPKGLWMNMSRTEPPPVVEEEAEEAE